MTRPSLAEIRAGMRLAREGKNHLPFIKSLENVDFKPGEDLTKPFEMLEAHKGSVQRAARSPIVKRRLVFTGQWEAC